MPPKISTPIERARTSMNVMLWLHDNERSQAWLARQIGISPEHLNRILKGHVALHQDIEDKLIEIIEK
jgi:plasmid maintenance system antidote protein VapI